MDVVHNDERNEYPNIVFIILTKKTGTVQDLS